MIVFNCEGLVVVDVVLLVAEKGGDTTSCLKKVAFYGMLHGASDSLQGMDHLENLVGKNQRIVLN